ncbi:MAG: DNA polymerase IV, partial [Dethiobacteria bacterium]
MKIIKDILLCDLDAFFASVEQRDRPELQGKPVIVGGSPDGRGVVSTCSYEARKFGVHSAMPMKKALSLCPGAVIIRGRMSRNKEVAGQVRHIFS